LVEKTRAARDSFWWGAATASYQIEGSPLADGSGSCIWHEFSHTPGNTYRGDTGDHAADHYHRWAEDVALMRVLGLNAYRFSIRWPRILPEGQGEVNQAGLDFYDRLLDALLEARIEPFVTLFHWDLPAALQHRGGWCNRDSAQWFAEYTEVVAARLGDRIRWWITLNEPFVVATEGHLLGHHAPGVRNAFAAARAVHNQLRAHIAADQVLRSTSPAAKVGLALHNAWVEPASDSEADILASRVAHAWHNFPLFLDPLVFGRYPAEVEDLLLSHLPQGYEADLDAMRCPPDFAGLNYYFSYMVRRDEDSWTGFAPLEEEGGPRTSMGWPIRPEGLGRLLDAAHRRYGLDCLLVTENGAAFEDALEEDAVHDPERVSYLEAHIQEVLKAAQSGLPVKGYFVWSFLDNFEWARGYSQRFGLVYVDYETQRRILKDSGWWYSAFVREQLEEAFTKMRAFGS